jgi:hypothetical protein
VIGVLRDDDPAAVARPQPGLSDLQALVEETRDAGTPVDLTERMARPEDLPDGLGRTAYRIVQEGLTNARKHAPGQHVQLLLAGSPGDQLLVELANPTGRASTMGPAGPAGSTAAGPAATVGTANPDGPPLNGSGTGTGLIGLAERVRLAGGEIDHGVGPDGEFRLRALLRWRTAPATPCTPAIFRTPGPPAEPTGPA